MRRQLAIAETAGDIDRETYSEIRSSLSDLEAKIQTQEEELVFYRGIVSPQDGVPGLRIQSLEVLPSDGERRYLLRLLLVQAIVHSRRVSGAVKLQLEGIEDGQTTSFDIAELAEPDESYDMAYEFATSKGWKRSSRCHRASSRSACWWRFGRTRLGRSESTDVRVAGSGGLKG